MQSSHSKSFMLAALTLGLFVLGSSAQASSLSSPPVLAVAEANSQVLAQFPFPDAPSRLNRRDRDDIEDRIEDRLDDRDNRGRMIRRD